MENMMEGSDTTAAQSLALGDSLFVDENYTGAVDAYAAGLAVFRQAADGLLVKLRTLSHRSAAFLQLGRYEEALEDAQGALNQLSMMAPVTLEMRAGESEMLYKRAGMAATNLQKMEEANKFFQQAYQLANLNGRDTKAYEEYIMISPPKTTFTTATKVAVPPATVLQKTPIVPPPIQKAPIVVPATTTIMQPPTMPKYQYYQSDKVMTIAILEPNVQPQDMEVDFRKKHLTVILRKRGVSFTVIAGTLYSEIEVDKSKMVIKDEKVLIKLRKVEHFDWHELLSKKKEEAVEQMTDKVNDEQDNNNAAATRPTPYASHKNWDKIEKDIEVQEKQETGEGDEALNKLFKQIYAGSDENTRRAMIKSYQTSGGTVLSTNWDDVKKKDYEKERVAPKGMEWKTWEGDKLPTKDDDE